MLWDTSTDHRVERYSVSKENLFKYDKEIRAQPITETTQNGN